MHNAVFEAIQDVMWYSSGEMTFVQIFTSISLGRFVLEYDKETSIFHGHIACVLWHRNFIDF